MSRLYFHSPHGTAALLGSERAWMGSLCNDVAAGVLDLRHNGDKIADLIADRDYTMPDRYDYPAVLRWRDSLWLGLTVGLFDREILAWRGHEISSFSLILNTAVAVGSDAVKLAARLHAQCELHAWVDGPNRAWLADVVQQGLDAGVFRTGFWFASAPTGPKDTWSSQGWDKVIELLRSRDDEPVVTSYSVGPRFPNRSIAGWEPPPMPDGWAPDWADTDEGRAEWERDHPHADQREEYYAEVAGDLWFELPAEEQWALGMAGLRARVGDGLELKPDDWQAFRFRHELSMLDLLAADRDERLAAVFELAEEPVDV